MNKFLKRYVPALQSITLGLSGLLTFCVLTAALVLAPSLVSAESRKEYSICWSHYTGWEPWGYAAESGILKKWADKYNISIKVDRINDYVESINLYTSGKYIGCAMTNMDALTIPAVGGIDSTALIVGDFSNGNDGVVLRSGNSISDLKGREIKLVQLSVSHYLLSRALTLNNLTEKDVKLVNTSDADIASVFLADKKGAAVTWNPMLMQVRNGAGVTMAFDSSKIPGEIIDLMVVRTDAPAELKKALVGAWFETVALMSEEGKASQAALEAMAKQSAATLAEFRAQLKTTALFSTPASAVEFTKGKKVQETMEYVRTFSFDHGLYGDGAASKDLVGIAFPDGTILGDKKNVKLRFDASWMEMAQSGQL